MDRSLFSHLTPLELSVKQSKELKEDQKKVKEKLDESIRELELTDAFRQGFATALEMYVGCDPYESSVETQTFLEDNSISPVIFTTKDKQND